VKPYSGGTQSVFLDLEHPPPRLLWIRVFTRKWQSQHKPNYTSRLIQIFINPINFIGFWVPLATMVLRLSESKPNYSSKSNQSSLYTWTKCKIPDDGGSMFLRNVGIYQQVHTTLQLQRTNIDIFTAVRTSNHTFSNKSVPIELQRGNWVCSCNGKK
jgi:hypothetical protein